MTKVKICGLKRMEDIEYVNELLPDYIGFVFAKSKRQVDLKQAITLSTKLDCRIKKVGVFVNEEIHRVKQLAKGASLDILQFHGNEDENYLSNFKDFTVWKSKSIDISAVTIAQDIMGELNRYSIDAVVLDSSVKGIVGGTGESFNWKLIPKINIEKKLILAGGLNQDNVDEAIRMAKPYAVDISSGVETDGVKDFNKIKKFIEKVRSIK
jgi:phosphoribosylanthranilate isomerase